LAADPKNGSEVMLLCEALTAAGRMKDAEEEIAKWELSLPPEGKQIARPMKLIFEYCKGDLNGCNTLLASFGDAGFPPELKSVKAQVLLAARQPRVAIADPQLAEVWKDPWHAMALYLSFLRQNDAEQAEHWRQKTRDLMIGFREEGPKISRMLESKNPPDDAEWKEVVAHPSDKALLAAVLALRFPAKQAHFGELARKLNVRRVPPSLLVRGSADGESHTVK
jgi:hypothetical protein